MEAHVTPAYSFVGDWISDPETWEAIFERSFAEGRELFVDYVETTRKPDSIREWNQVRYQELAVARNIQLERVKKVGSEYFLSLDSDILLHPLAIKNMLETAQKSDVVGGLCYMTEHGTTHPSYGKINRDGIFQRFSAQQGVFPVQVVMGIVLNNQKALDVAWESNHYGEDIGRCLSLQKHGLKIMADTRVVNKHCLTVGMLKQVDKRVGF